MTRERLRELRRLTEAPAEPPNFGAFPCEIVGELLDYIGELEAFVATCPPPRYVVPKRKPWGFFKS